VRSFWNVERKDSRESSRLTLVCKVCEYAERDERWESIPGPGHEVLGIPLPACGLVFHQPMRGIYSSYQNIQTECFDPMPSVCSAHR